MNITPDDLDQIKRWNSTLPPFTITIVEPEDATAIISAFLMFAGCGKEGADVLGAALGVSCKVLGVREGVDAWYSAVGEKRRLPKFLKPLIIHVFEHIVEEKEKK